MGRRVSISIASGVHFMPPGPSSSPPAGGAGGFSSPPPGGAGGVAEPPAPPEASNVFCVSGVARAVSSFTCGSAAMRSEEHTSELQSRRDLVCRLLLEKKKEQNHILHG